jgi:isocitrate dehydrogenase
LAEQDKDKGMKERFAKMYKELAANEEKIAKDLISVHGKAVDIGGYYLPDDKKATEVMRPSSILNKIIDEM